MQSVIYALAGWVPSDEFGGKAMRWMPPEKAVVERAKLDDAALRSAIELGEIVPERAWNPGDPLLLPPVPDSAYPADATPLDVR